MFWGNNKKNKISGVTIKFRNVEIMEFKNIVIMKGNVIKDKSFEFAIRIVNLYKYLTDSKKELTLSKQLLRSGTSIGANIEEGVSGQSKKDFIAKLSISLKEAKETHYWLRLLYRCEYLDKKMFDSIICDCDEIIVILTSILKTSRSNMNLEIKELKNVKINF